MKAVFFDRDGTIIVDKHYLHRFEDVEFYPETFEALNIIDSKGYKKFLVTNQSGVGRGYFPLEDVHKVHDYIQDALRDNNIDAFVDIAICPAAPAENSPRRKPSPNMILELVEKWQIELASSCMIGDKELDAETGVRAGCRGVTVHRSFDGYPFYKNLLDFAHDLP